MSTICVQCRRPVEWPPKDYKCAFCGSSGFTAAPDEYWIPKDQYDALQAERDNATNAGIKLEEMLEEGVRLLDEAEAKVARLQQVLADRDQELHMALGHGGADTSVQDCKDPLCRDVSQEIAPR